MAKVFIEESTLTAIGDAIRGKEGTTELVPVTDMATRITSLPSGGGSFYDFIPEEDCTLTGICDSAFSKQTNPNQNSFYCWLLENYPEKIKAGTISSASNLFNGQTTLTEIPFTLNFGSVTGTTKYDFTYIFSGCNSLKQLPPVTFSQDITSFYGLSGVFSNCHRIEEIPEDWLSFLVWGANHPASNSSNIGYFMFNACYSLRAIPAEILKAFGERRATSYSNHIYGRGFIDCSGLDEIVGLGCNLATLTSNMFNSTIEECGRLKNFTFATTADGSPEVRSWKNQTLDLYTNVGYVATNSTVNGYSTFTNANWVKDDATYQALKNDPDWWAQIAAYSRYNHDSAVNTINSLPDTSEYLATAGGTNTIRFRGSSGEKTDGGAINTLTEEEIAVAAAKGWTVTLS